MNKTLRPKTLDELIGQETLITKARIAIGAALHRGEPLPHTLLTSGSGGLGKTTFAGILANEMYSHVTPASGLCIRTAVNLRRVMVPLQPGSLLHIDECHAIGKSAAEELLLVLEEGVINLKLDAEEAPVRLALPPFTLIASTTRPSALSAPLRQRFGLHFHFDFYSVEDLTQITRMMADGLGIECDEAVCRAIALRGLGIPRFCLRRVERVRDLVQNKGLTVVTMQELERAMSLEGIDHLGLGPEHRRILSALEQVMPRGLSARSLALTLGTERSNVIEVIEPPLVRLGLMAIAPGGRRLTAQGLRYLRGEAGNA
jgi:Holliday junction DNA helicase RuvB